MFRSLAAGVGWARRADVARIMDLIRAAGLAAVLITVSLARPRPAAAGGKSIGIAVALGACAVGWTLWIAAGRRRRLMLTSLVIMSAAGGALTGLSPRSPAVAFGAMVAFTAGAHLEAEISLGIAAELLAAFLIAALSAGSPAGYLISYSFAFAGLWTLGLTRRAYLLRAQQAEALLAESRRAREAETHAAALAERARIARELHDVLAHSLAAVSVNLQAAEGLLAPLSGEQAEFARALAAITRAGAFTRDGMAAARRAVLALREDGTPLAEQLATLVDQHGAGRDCTAQFEAAGQARPLPAETALTAYRAAQEALTNARKHAPGQPVRLCLAFEPGWITVTAVNPLPVDGTAGPLAGTGAGYGLTGLRERAQTSGGTLEAGPIAGDWRVRLRIPA